MKIVTFLGSIFSWLWVVLLVVVVGLVVAGCVAGTKVDLAPKGGGEVGDAKVVIHLRMPGDFRPTGSTRGLTADDEKAIDNMWVLMFDTADRLLAIERAAMLVNSSYSVGLPPVPQGSQVKLVLVANAEDILEGTIGFIPENIPGGASRYNEIMPMIGEGISAPLFMNSGARIPMWGESDLVTVMPGMVVDRTVPLMRSVARVDIGVGQHTRADDGTFSWNGLTGPTGEASSKAIPFEMTAVYVVRPNNRYNVAPVLRNVDFSFPASPKATAPSVPVGATGLSVPASQANFRYEVDGLYTTQDIYVPEADIVMGGGDSDHRNRMALVVEGRYDQNGNGNYAEEPLSYYRVDFGNDKTFDNVLRNRLYSFSIQGVISTGQPTVETAYNSHAMNMSVSVVDWDQGSISNVWFDGPLYFAIDRQDVVFGPLRGGVEEMRIRTNIPEFEFYYRNNDSDTPEFSVDSPVFIDGKGYEYELIRVSPGEAADDEYILRIENPRDNVSATHDPAARLVDWVIHAGGTLRINYHVDQRWTNEYSSLADRQGTFLGPEGLSAGKALGIEVVSFYRTTIEATEVVNGVTRPAAWIHLGDTSGLSSDVDGRGYYYYQHDLVIDPFEYGETKDGVTDRTATITIFSTNAGGRVINYTITQQAPYIRIDRDAVSVPRPSNAAVVSAVEPVYVYTNIIPEHLAVTRTRDGSANKIDLLPPGELVSYDPRNESNRRFDVQVIFDRGEGSYDATFSVRDKAGLYGDLPVESVDIIVPPANERFEGFWFRATYAGSVNVWTPGQEVDRMMGDRYVFPWHTAAVEVDMFSNIGVAPDVRHMTDANIARLTEQIVMDHTNPGEKIHRYSFRTDDHTYSAPRDFSMAFFSTLQPGTQTSDITLRIGEQRWSRGEVADDGAINWKGGVEGSTDSPPISVAVADNVRWSATSGVDWIKLRINETGPFGVYTGVADDRVFVPVDENDPDFDDKIVKSAILEVAVEPWTDVNPALPSRTSLVDIVNEDYDDVHLGAVPGDITITQWSRQLHSQMNDMPGYDLLKLEDLAPKSYTFTALTNQNSWMVNIHELNGNGDRVNLLSSTAYSGAPVSETRGVVMSMISGVTLPAQINGDRRIEITLSAEGFAVEDEVHVGYWTVPSSNRHPSLAYDRRIGMLAPPGVLGVGAETGLLTLRGSKEFAGTDMETYSEYGPVFTETVYIALFKRGSLVGLSTYQGAANAATPYSPTDDIIWGAPYYNVEDIAEAGSTWDQIPSVDDRNDNYPAANNQTTGIGDPCSFADGRSDGDGPWKTPSGTSTTVVTPKGSIVVAAGSNFGAMQAWQLPGGGTVNGGHYQFAGSTSDPRGMRIYLPVSGYRDGSGTYNKYVTYGTVTNMSQYWINPNDKTSYVLYPNFNDNGRVMIQTVSKNVALPIRCVPR